MGTRIYVGNLSYQTTTQDLLECFTQVGEVRDAKVITDRETGQNRGFGFVTFATDASASQAIREFNGAMFMGRSLRVNEAEDRAPGGGGFSRPRMVETAPTGQRPAFAGGGNGFGGPPAAGGPGGGGPPPRGQKKSRRGGGRQKDDGFGGGDY